MKEVKLCSIHTRNTQEMGTFNRQVKHELFLKLSLKIIRNKSYQTIQNSSCEPFPSISIPQLTTQRTTKLHMLALQTIAPAALDSMSEEDHSNNILYLWFFVLLPVDFGRNVHPIRIGKRRSFVCATVAEVIQAKIQKHNHYLRRKR